MTHKSVHTMLDAFPKDLGGVDEHALAEAIDACVDCARVCTACADACLSEDMVADLARCIRTDLDCADVCAATGSVLSRQTARDATAVRALVEACRTVCGICAEECERHAEMHGHCRICAVACRRCEQACAELLGSVA